MSFRDSGRRFLLFMILILILAAGLRLAGISKEPFWLDEVCTSHLSEGSFQHILKANARDTHPPLYFLEVSLIRRVFGDSESAIRGLSTAWSLLGIVFLMLFARDIGGPRISIMAGLLAAVNPLDLYYAQEARMYSQAATLALASSYFLRRWFHARVGEENRSLPWAPWAGLYALSAVLLCLTHLVGTMILLAQGLYALGFFLWKRRFRQATVFVVIGLVCLAVVGAWASFVIGVRGVFFSRAILGWIPQATPSTVYRFLVDLFFFPFCGGVARVLRHRLTWPAWILVLFVLGSALSRSWGFAGKSGEENRPADRKRDRGLLLWLIFGPVVLVLLMSLFFEPVYYPPRFCLLVLAPFLVLAAGECATMRSWVLRFLVFGPLFLLMAFGSWCQVEAITKRGLTEFAAFWQQAGPPDAAVFSPNFNRIMASYYTHEEIPQQTRDSLQRMMRSADSARVWVCTTPGNVSGLQDEELAKWVLGSGSQTLLGKFDGIEIREVSLRRRPPVLLRGGRQIDFGSPEAENFLGTGWFRAEKNHRWSCGNRAELSFSLREARRFSQISMEIFCFHRQRISLVLNGKNIDSFVCNQRRPHLHETKVPEGSFEKENSLIFLLPDAVAPSELSESSDSRKLALGIRWFRIGGV